MTRAPTVVVGALGVLQGVPAARRPARRTLGVTLAGMADDSRPCKYCIANWMGSTTRHGGAGIMPESEDCEIAHRDDPRVYGLARAMAKCMQDRYPSDEQIGWFLEDADEVVDDFVPVPERWTVRRLPDSKNDQGIVVRLRINDVTYVVLEGGKECKGAVVRLSTYRQQLAAA